MTQPIALVIEDQYHLATLYEDALRLVGFNVVTARDGLEAINTLETTDAPNLIVLDINMPRISRKEVYSPIRGNPKYTQTLVAVTTANIVVAAEMKTLLQADDELLVKPASIADLQRIAKDAKRKSQAPPPAPDPASDRATADPPTDIPDPSATHDTDTQEADTVTETDDDKGLTTGD